MNIKIHKITVDVVCLYLIFLLLPLYVLQAKSLQPVDIITLFLFLYYCVKGDFVRISFSHKISVFGLVMILLLFQLLVLISHMIVHYVYETWELIEGIFYYIILLLTFKLMFQNLYKNYPLQKVYNILLNSLVITFIIPMGKLLLFGGSGGRETLSFNDPNQLVFFALTNLSILYYITLQMEDFRLKNNRIKALIIISLNLFVLKLSASRTGLILVILCIAAFFQVFDLKRIIRDKWIRNIVLLVIGMGVLYYVYLKFYIYISMVRPEVLSSSAVKNDFFLRAISGLQAQLCNTWSFLFGTGLSTKGDNMEFHDNFVGIFYQTGIFALILYVVFCWKLLLSAIRKRVNYCLPIVMYMFVSLSLYAFRTRFWWLLLAFMVIVIAKDESFYGRINNNFKGEGYNDKSYVDN